jgi:hypothetical protein
MTMAVQLQLLPGKPAAVLRNRRRQILPISRLNTGRLALALLRRPSSIQAGIASGPAPAMRHSRAADRTRTHLPDPINIALERLVEASLELPGVGGCGLPSGLVLARKH